MRSTLIMTTLKRIALSTTVCTLLASCGGGSTLLSSGGIGGSGISDGISIGMITGFGSVWVNGVRYDVSNASFIRDSTGASGQDEYRLGEVVTVRGSVNTDGTSGTAISVEFDDLLEGTVTQVNADGSTLAVLNQAVKTDSRTILHGFNTLTDLSVGNVVEVSGYQTSQEIRATSITLKQSSFTPGQSVLEIKGTVSATNPAAQTFSLGQWIVNYSGASLSLPTTAPQDGQYVEVKSLQALQGNQLIATEIELEDERESFSAGQAVELEGLVTAFTTSNQFSVNGQPVITTASTRIEYGTEAGIQLNTLIEVEGTVNSNGVLVATEISLEQGSDTDSREIKGHISALNQNDRTLMIGAVTIVIDNNTSLIDEINDLYVSIGFADLKANDYVEVDGSQLADGRILALKLEREND